MPNVDRLYVSNPDGTESMNTKLTGSKVTEGIADFVLNQQGTLLASAARTTSVQSADQTNYNAKGVLVILDVTAASATGGLTLRLWTKDPTTGRYIRVLLAPAAIIAVGTYGYMVYPGIGAGAAGNQLVNSMVSAVLPRTWMIDVAHGDASSYTYSVGYALIL